jgi:hypothetical protein
MFSRKIFFLACVALLVLNSCKEDEPDRSLQLSAIYVGVLNINLSGAVTTNVPVDQSIVLAFSSPVDVNSTAASISLKNGTQTVDIEMDYLDNNKSVEVTPSQPLANNTQYTVIISDQLTAESGGTFVATQVNFKTIAETVSATSLKIGGQTITGTARVVDIPVDLSVEINFSKPIDPQSLNSSSIQVTGKDPGAIEFLLSEENTKLTISTANILDHFSKYTFALTDQVRGMEGEIFQGLSTTFYTGANPEPVFPVIPDDELLSKVQQQIFKYFWDFAHPTSGMARERNTSGDIVTSGGSGFGIMAIIVGIERGFITREQGLQRFDKILDFLETSDRFHGAWSHWINGATGDVVPFSTNDNGGDLVETSYLIQGLLTFRQYLDESEVTEKDLIDRVNVLWDGVHWDWYTRNGQNVLYWHWSPDKEWIMNHPIRGYNECLITYVLAASSPAHSIGLPVYAEGWAANGGIKNGKSFYGIPLPLGSDYGGPLFFAHYSFLGLDPRNLKDTYADYWTQNVNHSRINRAYCEANPKNFVGYSGNNWGLTASDNQQGYSAHSPTNDLGVISPTAALSSFPYTPEESMDALKFFYYTLGDRLWGDYGFYDAFNITEGWTADSYLAIDQGPIIVMIENHRTGLLWDLFMSCPEVQNGLTKLNFTY